MKLTPHSTPAEMRAAMREQATPFEVACQRIFAQARAEIEVEQENREAARNARLADAMRANREYIARMRKGGAA